MSEQENRAVLDRINEECFNQGTVDAVDELFSEDFVEHNPTFPGSDGGRDGFKQMIHTMHSAFPDFRTEVLDQIAAGDRVVERWVSRGTHEGEFLGVPATGKVIEVEGMDISRLEGGRVVEHWTQMDTLGVLQQLGLVPTEEEVVQAQASSA